MALSNTWGEDAAVDDLDAYIAERIRREPHLTNVIDQEELRGLLALKLLLEMQDIYARNGRTPIQQSMLQTLVSQFLARQALMNDGRNSVKPDELLDALRNLLLDMYVEDDDEDELEVEVDVIGRLNAWLSAAKIAHAESM